MTDGRNGLTAQVLGLLNRLVGLSRRTKFAMVMANDALLCVASVIIAFSLRLGGWELWSRPIAIVTFVSIALWLPIFLYRGIYQSVVRFIGSRTMIGIATSCLMMAGGLIAVFMVNTVADVPRTIALLQPLVFGSLLVVSRLVARYILFDLLHQNQVDGSRSHVLIYGAGSAGRQLALSIRHEPNMDLRGYIDDDPRLAGKHLDGIRVHGSDDLAELIDRLEIDLVLLALPSVSRRQREQIVRKFENISVRVMTLPGLADIIDGSISINNLREIEITDLLGRDPVPPNRALMRHTIEGRTVMVTGAGGSIGSELCRQIIQFAPARLILVEMTEHALYQIDDEIASARRNGVLGPDVGVHAELANVADGATVRRLFDRWRPDTVFHAAAYKHVPLVEENPVAGMRNNVFGTYHCALEAERVGTSHFILVSTDKAVRPTNVMGATKRVCELILQARAARKTSTRFAIVRFGNVLGSSGSVVPRFQRQIRSGGPVTLTHREVTRYFMTIPEAAQLVIQAGAMAEGGEVYVLDMGDPIRIYDLARTMVYLSGLSVRDEAHPNGDIEIREVGLRKGEKLYEELLIGNSPQPTVHSRIMRARETFIDWLELDQYLARKLDALRKGDRETALTLLSTLVPEFVGAQSRNLQPAEVEKPRLHVSGV